MGKSEEIRRWNMENLPANQQTATITTTKKSERMKIRRADKEQKREKEQKKKQKLKISKTSKKQRKWRD